MEGLDFLWDTKKNITQVKSGLSIMSFFKAQTYLS